MKTEWKWFNCRLVFAVTLMGKAGGLGETWSTPHPTTSAWLFFTAKPPCPLNSRGEEGRNDALDSSEAPTRLLVHLEKRGPGQLASCHRELQTPPCHIASFPRQQMSHSCRAGLQLHHTTWTTYLMYRGCFCRHLGKIFSILFHFSLNTFLISEIWPQIAKLCIQKYKGEEPKDVHISLSPQFPTPKSFWEKKHPSSVSWQCSFIL